MVKNTKTKGERKKQEDFQRLCMLSVQQIYVLLCTFILLLIDEQLKTEYTFSFWEKFKESKTTGAIVGAVHDLEILASCILCLYTFVCSFPETSGVHIFLHFPVFKLCSSFTAGFYN